jgi:hypothetical protein
MSILLVYHDVSEASKYYFKTYLFVIEILGNYNSTKLENINRRWIFQSNQWITGAQNGC